jgi:hypothetical protein
VTGVGANPPGARTLLARREAMPHPNRNAPWGAGECDSFPITAIRTRRRATTSSIRSRKKPVGIAVEVGEGGLETALSRTSQRRKSTSAIYEEKRVRYRPA